MFFYARVKIIGYILIFCKSIKLKSNFEGQQCLSCQDIMFLEVCYADWCI